MTCAGRRKFVDAYMDGELDAAAMLQVETHLTDCPSCDALLNLKRTMKREIKELGLRVTAPEHLRHRIRQNADRRHPRLIAAAAGVAAAAAILFVVWASPWDLTGAREEIVSKVVEDVVSRHNRPLPMEVTGADPGLVQNWFRGKLDFPVQPPGPGLRQASFEGARVSNVQEQQAAHMTYLVDGRRVTLMIFPSDNLRITGGNIRTVDGRGVLVGTRRGYNVVMTERDGVIYALSSDLPTDRLISLLIDKTK